LLKPVELNVVLANTRSDLIVTEPDDKLKTCMLVGLLFVKAADKKFMLFSFVYNINFKHWL